MRKMNMKTTPIDKAERERLDIETRISILRLQIDKYSKILDGEASEEMYIKAKTIIEREEKYLQQLKDKYPEYFI
jgi:hypothetical protein